MQIEQTLRDVKNGHLGLGLSRRQQWAEMQGNWNAFALESQMAVDGLVSTNNVELNDEITSSIDEECTEENYAADTRTVQTQARIGQHFFRRAVISAYAGRCCITGLSHPSLLVASHIVPWSKDKKNRLNPRNGLCLSMLHDKAFDQGLITLNSDYTIKVSSSINKMKNNLFASEWLIGLEGKAITLPEKFSPSLEFIEWHRDTVFN